MPNPTAKKIFRDYDFNRNKLLKSVLEGDITANLTSILTVLGQIGYDTTLLRAKIFDGSAIRYLLQNNDLDTDITLAANSDARIATQKATKAYVDNLFTSGNSVAQAFDASVATTFPVGVATDKYRVTVPGTVQGVALEVGDVFYPKVATPTAVAADWYVVQANTDQATETVVGLIKIATQVLADAGVNDLTAVTPLKLKTMLGNNKYVRQYTQSVVLTANTVSTITHALSAANSGKSVIASAVLSSDGTEVEIELTPASTNTINAVASASITVILTITASL